MVVGGGALLPLGVYFWRVYSASKTWPSTEGRILTSRLVYKGFGRSAGYSGTYCGPVITYTYRAPDGQQYEGAAEAGNMGASKAKKWIRSNPVGTKIAVSYDPALPEYSAVLGHRGMKLSTLKAFGAGTFLFLLGALFVVEGLCGVCF